MLLSIVLNFAASLLYNHSYFYAFIYMKGKIIFACHRICDAYLLMFEKFCRSVEILESPSWKSTIKY